MINNDNKIILVLRGEVLIPYAMTPLLLGKPISIKTLEHAIANGGVGIFLQKNTDSEIMDVHDINSIGVYGEIIEFVKDAKGNVKILFEGKHRIQLRSVSKNDVWYGDYDVYPVTSQYQNEYELEVLWKQFYTYYTKYKKYNYKLQECGTLKNYTISEIEKKINAVAAVILSNFIDKQKYISKELIEEQIYFLINYMNKEMAIHEVEKKIKADVQDQLEISQKEYYLKEQMKAIQKELNIEKDYLDQYSLEYVMQKALEKKLPEYVVVRLKQEARRLEQMQELSAEGSVIRGYIDWLFALPWNNASVDTIAIEDAQKLLDQSHLGLDKVKERILEFVGALKYAGNNIKKPIICLVGPPGVGKTSFVKAIAEALNREFVSIPLGGTRDEADIKGHRKTYVAAMPGKIIQAFKKVFTNNPVILLDEIDKMVYDNHGDPAASLLEILDQEQNKNFVDSYLDINFDLSHSIFIATANHVENIPYPLLDRLDVVYLSGYTILEKALIVKKFLFGKILAEHGIAEEVITLSDEAIHVLISDYTKESGVRQLSRLLVRLVRKIINKFFLTNEQRHNITVDIPMITEFFKYPIYKNLHIPNPENKIGIMSGLAWTEVGGDVLEIETVLVPGKGNIQLTGQLGDVMQESAQTALTYVKSQYKKLKILKKKFFDFDIHIHIPEGATPKDGPSAGIAITTALISLFTNTPINNKIAMTGEVTLQGRILAIGGIKEKILAAEMNGYKSVILPLENKINTQEILEELSSLKLQIIYCDHVNEILKIVFDKKK
jgi:ATP-dependent Lon protease